MREIKFRAWCTHRKLMYSFDELELMDSKSELSFHSLVKGIYANWIPLQFTGLKDKNGKEIYEGDITDDNIGFGFVEFSEGAYRVNFRNGTCKWFIDYLDSEKKTLEVIGNIYENPELIK